MRSGLGFLLLLGCADKAPASIDSGVVLEDLDGDGVLDFVTADYLGDTISIGLGAGDGTFGPGDGSTGEAAWIYVGYKPLAVSLADMDDDGDLDVVVGGQSMGVKLLENGGL